MTVTITSITSQTTTQRLIVLIRSRVLSPQYDLSLTHLEESRAPDREPENCGNNCQENWRRIKLNWNTYSYCIVVALPRNSKNHWVVVDVRYQLWMEWQQVLGKCIGLSIWSVRLLEVIICTEVLQAAISTHFIFFYLLLSSSKFWNCSTFQVPLFNPLKPNDL
jgi:hypothetical protein